MPNEPTDYVTSTTQMKVVWDSSYHLGIKILKEEEVIPHKSKLELIEPSIRLEDSNVTDVKDHLMEVQIIPRV